MAATLSNEELVGLVGQRTRKFRDKVAKLDGTPTPEEILEIARRFKRAKDANALMEARLNTALESQSITVDEL